MYCPYCGSDNGEGGAVAGAPCVGCGRSIGGAGPAMKAPVMVLACAIVATMCGCAPFAIVGLVYAGMCLGRHGAGQYDALTKRYRSNAIGWTAVGFGLAVLVWILYAVLWIRADGFSQAP